MPVNNYTPYVITSTPPQSREGTARVSKLSVRAKQNMLIALAVISTLAIIGATLFFMRGDLQTVMSILTQRMDMPIWKCATLIGEAGAGIGFISALAINAIQSIRKRQADKAFSQKIAAEWKRLDAQPYHANLATPTWNIILPPPQLIPGTSKRKS